MDTILKYSIPVDFFILTSFSVTHPILKSDGLGIRVYQYRFGTYIQKYIVFKAKKAQENFNSDGS